VKLTQYTKQERAIAAADSSGIRERWLWGLRLLDDPQMFREGSTQLIPGVREALIHAAAKRGVTLSDSEIARRLNCARTYKTEAEFSHAVAEFQSWRDLSNANFPAYKRPDGEPDADYREKPERDKDTGNWVATAYQEEHDPGLFKAAQWMKEPTVRDLAEYAAMCRKKTEGYAATDRRRDEYVATLVGFARGDDDMLASDAHRAAFGDDPAEPSDG
jgi:hypothetical protein